MHTHIHSHTHICTHIYRIINKIMMGTKEESGEKNRHLPAVVIYTGTGVCAHTYPHRHTNKNGVILKGSMGPI